MHAALLLAVAWSDIWGGVVAGLIASLIVWGFSSGRRRWRNRADFGSLAGDYEVEEKATNKPEGTATLTGTGPTLGLRWVLEDGTVTMGTIVMNEASRVDGAGSPLRAGRVRRPSPPRATCPRRSAERVEGIGVPPVKELIQKLLDHQVPIYV
jgi:hypothetical protein